MDVNNDKNQIALTKVHVDKMRLRLTWAGSRPGVPYVKGARKLKLMNNTKIDMPITTIVCLGDSATTILGLRLVVGPIIETG